ncbi:MAG: DUF3109 family protein [Bacteroidales bacterium]
MFKINRTLISLDVIEEFFICGLDKCKGACCVQGAAGAPLLPEEIEKLKEIFDIVKEYLRPECLKEIETKGVCYTDADGEPVTQLNHGEECAFTIFESGIARCAIEKAYLEGKITFRKPVSCHLYPVRVRKFNDFDAVNYDRWDICKPAILLGNRKKTRVYEFVAEALIRRFGDAWYKELELTAKEYLKEKSV